MQTPFFMALLLLSASANAADTKTIGSSVGNYAGINCTQTSSKDSTEMDESCSIAVGVIDVREFDFPPRIQVGNETLLQNKEGSSPNQVRLIPLKKGTTSVFIDDHQGGHRQRIIYNIITNDLSGKVNAIRDLLADIEGITVRSLDDKIVIDGELLVPRDFDRIVAVQQAYSESVLNLVTLSRIAREAIARRMQKEINESPTGINVTVRVMNDTFFLNGKVESRADKEHAELVAQTYLPETMGSQAIKEGFIAAGLKRAAIIDQIEVEEQPPAALPKMIRITYHFVEISKNYLKQSFFKWTPMLSQNAGIQIGSSTTGGVAASGSGSFAGTISSLFPKLQSGTQGGFARVLFSTVSLGMDGSKVEINRKDNVPYISAIVNGVPLPAVIPIGMGITVTPKIEGEDKVKLDTFFDFSAFNGGTGAGGAPSFTTTKMSNSILVKSGDSAVLGGLVSNNVSKNIGQDPTAASGGGGGGGSGGASGASGGDPLFSLLHSKAFQNNKTQFVVFITPKIVEDASEGTADIKAKIINNTKKRQRTIQ